MPPIGDTSLNQTAVYWPPAAGHKFDEYGEPLRGEPVEVRCSWEWRRRDVRQAKEGAVLVDAVAYLAQEVKVGGHMWLGTLDAWNGTGVSQEDNDLCVVVGYGEVTDLRGASATREARLARWKDTLPEEGA